MGTEEAALALLLAAIFQSSTLVDITGAGHFPFDLCPKSAEICILTVHHKATFNQRPGFTELLPPIMLQCPPQEALSQTQPPQASFHTLDSSVPVELQCPTEVVQSCSFSGAVHQAAASSTQVLHPDIQLL